MQLLGGEIVCWRGVNVPFDPAHPLERFCSCECREANRRWEVWRAGQTYRGTEHGKARRREQRVRARARAKENRPPDAAVVPDSSFFPEATSAGTWQAGTPLAGSADCSVCAPEKIANVLSASHSALSEMAQPDAVTATSTEPEVGHQKDGISEKSCCFRPGCYVQFAVTTRSPQQCFCSAACRNALRRVRQRESHWFRRLGLRPRHRGSTGADDD